MPLQLIEIFNKSRDEIASCLEKSYPEIGCAEAARMLSLPPADLEKYSKERNWTIRSGKLFWQVKKILKNVYIINIIKSDLLEQFYEGNFGL